MRFERRAWAFNKLEDAIELKISPDIKWDDWDDFKKGEVGKKRYIIMLASDRDIPYKQTPFPVGVKSIPANIDTCPCCKRKLEKRNDI